MSTQSTTPKVRLTKDLDAVQWPAKLRSDAELQTLKAAVYGTNVDENWDSPLNWSQVNSDPAGTGLLVDAGTAPAAGVERAFSTRKGAYEQHIAAINGTAVWSSPLVTSSGLALTTDADASDGILSYEITQGVKTNSYAAKTVGSMGQDAFFECAISIADVSSLTELIIGWRKAEAYRVDADDYDEAAAFNVGAGADGRINTWTILNNAATTTTNTGLTALADNGTATLRVVLKSDGRTEFYVDGTRYQPAAQFAFDSGEVVVPFCQITAETGDPGVVISSWRCGWL